MKRRLNYICKLGSAHDRAVVSSLELGDGTGPATSNLWSVSTPELSFTANGFSSLAYLRSGYPSNNPNYNYVRIVDSNGGFNYSSTTSNNYTLRPAVHITPVQNPKKSVTKTNLIRFVFFLGLSQKCKVASRS